jgi:hypothetical protein
MYLITALSRLPRLVLTAQWMVPSTKGSWHRGTLTSCSIWTVALAGYFCKHTDISELFYATVTKPELPKHRVAESFGP